MSTDYAFIPGYGMRYSVTRDGRVYSNVTQRWLKPIKHPLGYVCVNLTLRDGIEVRPTPSRPMVTKVSKPIQRPGPPCGSR